MTRMLLRSELVRGFAFGIVVLLGVSLAGCQTSGSGSANLGIEKPGQQTLVPLALKLPPPGDTFWEGPTGPHQERYPDTPRPPFLVAPGVTNIALGKPVASNVINIYTGSLEQVTDGEKGLQDDCVVDLSKGMAWVQIDLQAQYPIFAIVVWHDYRRADMFYDVIIRASNDPDFKTDALTLFNNDYDESLNLSRGTDKNYWETNEGKLIDAKRTEARYLRFYSRGSRLDGHNKYQEIEVYSLPK